MNHGKQRTITLTSRPPVRIFEHDWPILSAARETEDGARWWLTVRRHKDGRTIVYARMEIPTEQEGSEKLVGGEVLEKGADVVASIRQIGEVCHCSTTMIARCIAGLPAEDL